MVRVDGVLDKVVVSADGNGMVGLAGAGLLALCADRVGLTRALSGAMSGIRRRRGRHDPGRVVRNLAVMLACGGDSVSDMAVLGGQERLFGGVASQATPRRAVAWVAEDAVRLESLRAARAKARSRAWKLGARPERIVIDIDATLTSAYSQKERLRGTSSTGSVITRSARIWMALARRSARSCARGTPARTLVLTRSRSSSWRSGSSRERSSSPSLCWCAPTAPARCTS